MGFLFEENFFLPAISKPFYFSIKRASADSVANFDMIIISTETFAEQIRETLERLNYQGKVVVLSELFEELKCID